MNAAFRPGDKVRVRQAHPPGHARAPFYIRGRLGEVASIAGEFPDPEELAYGRDGLPKKTLYRVRFRQNDLWPDYAGSAADSLIVDVYENWLEGIRLEQEEAS